MTAKLPLVLKVMAVTCLVPALLHGLLGVKGDMLIGAPLPNVVDATVDSQNCFYGVAFGGYAILLWLASTNIKQYAAILYILFAAIFVAGCAQFLAYFAYGMPSTEVMLLWSTEIALPPILWLWLKRHETSSGH